MKRIFAILTSLFTFLLLTSFKSGEDINSEVTLYSYKSKTANTQTYNVNGNEHTIYWAQGIEAPKMSGDETLLGSEGYFEKVTESLSPTTEYVTYQYKVEQNKGYYDLNKDVPARPNEENLCYLAVAGNLLSYWFDQNETYIRQYMQLLDEGNVYGQVPGLRKILPYDEQMWNDFFQRPEMTLSASNLLNTEMGRSKLITKGLTNYYNITSNGFFTDRVIDFFINGYKGYEEKGSPNFGYINDEENFVKDSFGGVFHPIFGKTRLTERYTSVKYSTFNKLLKEFFTEGKVVGLSFVFSAAITHGITVWGAEYDENNNLTRIYVTDSDDFANKYSDTNIARGIHSLDVKYDDKDAMYISNDVKLLNKGAQVNGIYTLSMGSEIWEERLNDLSSPKTQTINGVKGNRTYPLNANGYLDVNHTYDDNGYVEYQWYEKVGNDNIPLFNEKHKKMKLDTSKPGKRQYFLEIRNNKNGKTNITKSELYDVIVDSSLPLVNAEKPSINFNYYLVEKPVGSTVRVNVDAKVNDGGTLSYQWYSTPTSVISNPTKLVGETKPYIDIKFNEPGRIFIFCEVTNTNNSENVTGDNVVSARPQYSKQIKFYEKIYVNADLPTININPSNLEVYVDSETKLTVDATVTDGGTLSYKWYKVDSNYNETLLENETSNELIIDTSKPSNFGYRCVVTNYNEKALENKTVSAKSSIVYVNVIKKLSSNNKLDNLTIKGHDLAPSFDKDVNEYDLHVHVNVDQLDIDYVLPTDAKVEINNPVLTAGKNVVTIKVIAEDGTINTYTINVTKDESHSYGEWVVVTKPTFESTGLKERVCSICGHKETEIIDKLIPLTPIEPIEPEVKPEPETPVEPEVKPDPQPIEPEVKPEPETPIEPEVKPDPQPENPDVPEIKPNPGLPEVKPDNHNNVVKNILIGVCSFMGIALISLLIFVIIKATKKK